MNHKDILKPKFIVVTICLLALAVFGFFSYQARNEVFYLCGNFKQGVSYSGVIRQLETTNLSGYTVEKSEAGKRVVHSSSLNFHLVRCKINFNSDDVVVSAVYE